MSGGDGTYSGNSYEVVVEGGFATVYKKVGLQFDFHLLPNTYWQAGTAVNAAQAARDGAQATLNHLYAVAADPQSAQAQVEQVQAALSTLQTQRARARLTAPQDGLVTQRYVALGELAVSGVPLLTIADLSHVTLTVYVPVPDLGSVNLGQTVDVRVDSFPARTFQGIVVTIAGQAEFTPSVTQTKEERVKLVFAVKVRLPNAGGALKPGMPADAVFLGRQLQPTPKPTLPYGRRAVAHCLPRFSLRVEPTRLSSSQAQDKAWRSGKAPTPDGVGFKQTAYSSFTFRHSVLKSSYQFGKSIAIRCHIHQCPK